MAAPDTFVPDTFEPDVPEGFVADNPTIDDSARQEALRSMSYMGAPNSLFTPAPKLGPNIENITTLARAIPADVAAGMSLLKRPEGPAPLLPSLPAIRKNLPAAAEASGNIPAALRGETELPIDVQIDEAAKESVPIATVARLSQDLAATAPLAAIGLLPATAVRLATAGFTIDMLAHAPELFNQYAEEINLPPNKQDPAKLAKLQSGILQTFTMAPLAGAHGFGKPASSMIGEVKAAFDNASRLTPKEPNAETIRSDTGPVREQGRQPEVVQDQGGENLQQPPPGQREPMVEGRPSLPAPQAAEANPVSNEVPLEPRPVTPLVEKPAAQAGEPPPVAPENRAVEPSTPPPTPSPESAAAALPAGEASTSPAKPSVTPDVTEASGTQGAIGTSPVLLPSGASAALPPKSQRQIIVDLSKGLNIPVRFGRLTTPKYGGYFKKVADLIGSKRPNDLPTVSHEVGHKLDSTFSLSSDKTIASELDVLGDPATPGSASSWTKSKTKKYKLGEGMAEYIRYWLTDPLKASSVAPKTHMAFEAIINSNKDVGDVMRQAQSDIQTWRNSEPQMRLRSQISVGENPNKTPYTLSQATRDLVDDLHILRLAVDDAKAGGDVPPSRDPYLLARNLRGSYGMAETFIRNGTIDFKTKAVELGKSLEDALAPISGRMADFRDWIVAKRAQELRSQGRETGLISTDVDATASKFDADPAFQDAFTRVKEWNDSVLQYAVDSGMVTADGAKAMRKMNQDYVPFHRLFEVGAGEFPSQQSQGIGQGLNVGKPGSLKGLKGSRRNIVDPIETMVKNAYTMITASEKSAINNALADISSMPGMGKWVEKVAAPKESVRVELERIRKQLEDAGADLTKVPDDLLMSFFRQSGRAPFGENIIRVIHNDKPEFYRLNRELHDTFKALDLEDTGKLIRILSAPAQLLRAGVTLEPTFAAANMLRDTFGSAVIGKYGALPFETTLKGMAAMLKNPKLVSEWAASGGKSAVEANFFDRTKMQKYLAEKVSKELTPAEQAMVVVKSPLTALRWLTSVGEEATRIGEYKAAFDKLTKSGMPEGEARRLAAFEARDRQDFAKGGAKTKIVRHMAAFWNANLQANVKLAQSFKQRPARTILQGLAFVTIPKLIEQAVNWDDEDYWNRPQWERDAFFMIPAGKDDSGHTRFVRIPTPFEVGIIFGTLPGRILQYAKQNDPESVKDFPKVMLKNSVPNPIPNFMLPVFEDFLSGKQGWDIWRGRPVVPERLADLPPGEQWTDQTTGIAKHIGSNIGFSPIKIDHIIEQSTGGMGKLVTGKQVPGRRFVTTPLNLSNQATEDFYSTLEGLREKRASLKAKGSSQAVNGLAGFESTARELASLRDQARRAKDEQSKSRYQEQMYQKAKAAMAGYRRANP